MKNRILAAASAVLLVVLLTACIPNPDTTAQQMPPETTAEPTRSDSTIEQMPPETTAEPAFQDAPTGSTQGTQETIQPAATIAQPQSKTTAEPAFQDILQGEAQFLYASDNGVESMDISGVPALFAPDDPYMKIWDFAVVDLDGDENAEAVLSVYGAAGDAGGYLILHQIDGKFYGYTSDFQSFQGLKADGTYSYTVGIAEAGICTVSGFTETGFASDKITYGSGPQEGWDTFVVDHQPATAEAYWAAIDKQNAKPDAAWYAFTRENT